MAKGSCLCGAIAFEVENAGIVVAVTCSCSNCQKVSGSQYGVYLQVRPGSFRWLSGQDDVATFESSPGNRRGFCRHCGSVAPVATAYGAMRVPGGVLDDDPGPVSKVAIFTDGAVSWCAQDGAQHSFVDTGPPDFWRKIFLQLLSPV